VYASGFITLETNTKRVTFYIVDTFGTDELSGVPVSVILVNDDNQVILHDDVRAKIAMELNSPETSFVGKQNDDHFTIDLFNKDSSRGSFLGNSFFAVKFVISNILNKVNFSISLEDEISDNRDYEVMRLVGDSLRNLQSAMDNIAVIASASISKNSLIIELKECNDISNIDITSDLLFSICNKNIVVLKYGTEIRMFAPRNGLFKNHILPNGYADLGRGYNPSQSESSRVIATGSLLL
jgi:hypothetical protein